MPQVPVISIIDDDVSVRNAIRTLVRSRGYLAHTYASADEFLESSHLKDTSCIVADVQMPDMSGIELQSLLAERGSTIPFIFITAFPEKRLREKALAAGATCFLSKPIFGEQLAECINKALKQPG